MNRHNIIFGLLMLVFTSTSAFAANDSLILEELNDASGQVALAFKRDDPRLPTAVQRLVRAEGMWLGVLGDTDLSYLRGSPLPMDAGPQQVAAWVWLERNRRKGIDLSPVSFFEGRTFE